MKKYIFPVLAAALSLSAAAQTTTSLVVTQNDGSTKSFETSQIKGVVFSDMPNYKPANYLLSASYSTSNGMGNYIVQIGTGAPDSSGDPAQIGDKQVSFFFVAPKSENAVSAVLPEGFYTIGAGNTPFTFNPEKSAMWERTGSGSDDIAMGAIIGGSVDVSRNGSEYLIKMEVATTAGTAANLVYEGPINFTVGASEFESFTEPVDLKLDGLQGRFYANWFFPFADDITVQGYTGEFDNNTGAQISGYWLTLPLNMPKIADPKNATPRIADGVYKMESRTNPKGNTYLPMTWNKGGVIDFMGTMYETGGYLIYRDPTGLSKIAYLSGGTVTFSDNGTKMVLDCVSETGVPVKITYSGKPYIENKCNNEISEIKRPWSTLKEDQALAFLPTTVGIYFKDEPTIVEGLNTYTFWITDYSMDKGDYIQLTILTSGEGIGEGTYTVGTTFTANTALPGWTGYGGADLNGSWYADLSSTNADGYQDKVAPINGGTFTVSFTGDTQYGKNCKIVFDLKDDNNHSIKGEYNGMLVNGDDMAEQTSVKARAAKMRIRK